MSGESDDALWRGLQTGDEPSLRELFVRYYDPLGRFAYGFTRQRELAEESVAAVFEELWRRRREVTITASVRAWLYGAVRLKALAARRAATRQAIRIIATEDAAEPAHDETGRRLLLREELSIEVGRLLDAMPPQRQLIFRLNRFDGLRYREIAEILGLSEQTVQNHMVLAIRQLAPALPRLRELSRT